MDIYPEVWPDFDDGTDEQDWHEAIHDYVEYPPEDGLTPRLTPEFLHWEPEQFQPVPWYRRLVRRVLGGCKCKG